MNQPIQVVDMYPTLTGLAGAPSGRAKPLDGMNVWPAISEGKPSPRSEVVYDIEPFRAALRVGDWKLVWQATLPSTIELFDLAKDPSEQTNVAGANPEKVTELQRRVDALAREAVAPLILQEAFGTLKHVLFGSVAFPEDARALEIVP